MYNRYLWNLYSSGYLKPLEYFCITCDDRGQITQVTLLDQTDAADLDKALVGSEPPPSGTVMLWGIRQGMLRQSGAVVSQEVMKKDLTFQRLHLQAKALNGDFIFSPKEQALFEGWKKGMDATEWKTLCSCICTARPNALRRAKRTAL